MASSRTSLSPRRRQGECIPFASFNLTELHHLPPLTSSVVRRQAEASLMALRGEMPVEDQKPLCAGAALTV